MVISAAGFRFANDRRRRTISVRNLAEGHDLDGRLGFVAFGYHLGEVAHVLKGSGDLAEELGRDAGFGGMGQAAPDEETARGFLESES